MFEKILKERISSYLVKINFFTKYQFGFRANRSTENAVAALSLEINDAQFKGKRFAQRLKKDG